MSTIEYATVPSASQQRVLVVEFQSLDGQTCTAIGGGSTSAEAIEYARDSCQAGALWDAVGWNDLYGE
jgi:hypothetical protein